MNMNKFKIIIKSPILSPNFLLKNIAKTSVPSKTAPPLIENPIPAPRKKPPKIATSNLSLVITGKETKAKTVEKRKIEITVFIEKVLPKTK